MIQLPQPLQLDLRDLSGAILGRLNTFAREAIATLAGLRDRHEVVAVDWLGGSTNVRVAVGSRPVLGFYPCRCSVVSTGVAVALPGITWRPESPQVVVEALSGLSVGTAYRVSFHLIRD